MPWKNVFLKKRGYVTSILLPTSHSGIKNGTDCPGGWRQMYFSQIEWVSLEKLTQQEPKAYRESESLNKREHISNYFRSHDDYVSWQGQQLPKWDMKNLQTYIGRRQLVTSLDLFSLYHQTEILAGPLKKSDFLNLICLRDIAVWRSLISYINLLQSLLRDKSASKCIGLRYLKKTAWHVQSTTYNTTFLSHMIWKHGADGLGFHFTHSWWKSCQQGEREGESCPSH